MDYRYAGVLGEASAMLGAKPKQSRRKLTVNGIVGSLQNLKI